MIARTQTSRELYNKGTMPARNKKNFRPTKSGAGMTRAGVAAYMHVYIYVDYMVHIDMQIDHDI